MDLSYTQGSTPFIKASWIAQCGQQDNLCGNGCMRACMHECMQACMPADILQRFASCSLHGPFMFPPCSLHIPNIKRNPAAKTMMDRAQSRRHIAICMSVSI